MHTPLMTYLSSTISVSKSAGAPITAVWIRSGTSDDKITIARNESIWCVSVERHLRGSQQQAKDGTERKSPAQAPVGER